MSIKVADIFGKAPQDVATTEASAAGTRVYGILFVAGSDASTLTLTNTGGSAIITIKLIANTSKFLDLTQLGGIPFYLGCTVTLAGTGPKVYLWADETFS